MTPEIKVEMPISCLNIMDRPTKKLAYIKYIVLSFSIKLRINKMDKTATTESGALVMKPAEFVKATSELNKMVKELDEMRVLAKEKREREKTIRGGGQEGLFENPDKANLYM